MNWQQLHITVKKDGIADFEDALLALGAVAITCSDAGEQDVFQLEPEESCSWDYTKVTGLFTEEVNLAEIVEQLQKHFDEVNYYSEQLPDQQWERAWLKDFKPMQFGNNTWICPTGFDQPQPNAINILLDPGLAFGTGTHPTTALCLTWIDQHDLKNKIVIDYGCGSGILAIAALKHGAAKVIAVDHDPQALIATKENAQRNNLDPAKLEIYLPQDVPKNIHADVVLANILAQPLVTLVETFADFLKPKGDIVLSGVLHNQADMIIAAYQAYFKKLIITQQGDWLLLTSNKQ